MGNCSTFLAAFVAGMRSSADEVEVDGEVRSSGLSERSETSDAPENRKIMKNREFLREHYFEIYNCNFEIFKCNIEN